MTKLISVVTIAYNEEANIAAWHECVFKKTFMQI